MHIIFHAWRWTLQNHIERTLLADKYDSNGEGRIYETCAHIERPQQVRYQD